MDAVKEALLEQKVDDLALRFDQVDVRLEQVDTRFAQVDARFDRVEAQIRSVEVRNSEEHGLMRSDIRELRAAIQDVNRTIAFGFASIVASVFGSVAVVLVAQAL